MSGQSLSNIGNTFGNKNITDTKSKSKNNVSLQSQRKDESLESSSLNMSPSAISGQSLVVNKKAVVNQPRIKVCIKSGKSEREKFYDSIKEIVVEIMTKAGVENAKYIANYRVRDVLEQALKKYSDFNFLPEMRNRIEQTMTQYYKLSDKDFFKTLDDKKLMDKLLWSLESFCYYSEIENIMTALKKNANVSDSEINPSGKVVELCRMLEQEDLSFIYDYLTDVDANDTEEQKKRLTMDFSRLYTRSIRELLEQQLSLSYAKKEYITEFLECNDEEFVEKIDKLNKRPYLVDKINDLSYKTWSKMLSMPDEEYDKLVTPVVDRNEAEPINYKAELEAMLHKAFDYDIKEAIEITSKEIEKSRTSLKNYETSRPDYDIASYFEFKPLEKKDKIIPFEKLPTTNEAMEILKKTGKFVLDIKNLGGLNPTHEDNPVIDEEGKERLWQEEEAGMNISYGKEIGWSNQKIARDILQNFYNGNGHTLEGVKYDIQKDKKGVYTVKINGEGVYSYDRIDALGNGSSTPQANDAGGFGEGTRIVAVNLLTRKDTPYIKFACGDWSMTFGRSEGKLNDAYMTQVLGRNDEPVKGNYVEFKTKDKDLVKSIIEAKNYFYSPYNEDFQDFDFENEFFGFKNLEKNEKGNLYVVQRYQVKGKMDKGLDKMTLAFKQMPNSPEIKRLNNGKEYEFDEVRDRPSLYNYQIKDLCELYIKTMKDKDLMQAIASLKDYWIVDKNRSLDDNPLILDGLLDEAIKRKLAFKFDDNKSDYKFLAIQENTSTDKINDYIKKGYTPVIGKMSALGIKTPIDIFKDEVEGKESAYSLNITPDKEQEKKIRLINEATDVIRQNLELSEYNQILEDEVNAPTLIFNPDKSTDYVAEAIIKNGEFKGQWTTTDYLNSGCFNQLLGTKLHEICHKYGTDDSEIFTQAIIDIQLSLMKGLVDNPVSLQKIRIIESLFENSEKYIVNDKFDIEKFKKDLKNVLNKPYTYAEYSEDASVGKISTNLTFVQKLSRTIKGLLTGLIDYSTEFPEYKLEAFPPKEKKVEVDTLPDILELEYILHKTGKLLLEIPNRGGMNPTNEEKPVIHIKDIYKLGKTQKAKIKLKYGKNINWSRFKIARDIIQNFYDGNGHTLEGVTYDIKRNDAGEYTVRVKGKGNYDYKHLKALGHNKGLNSSNAGKYGEGTRIVAVNMLANFDVPYVKYACGDWAMTFGKNSDDVEKGDMTQTLTKNEQPVDGNYIEFKTKDVSLISALLNAKDYFYHPDNVDFQNLDYENDYLAVKILDNPKEKGNLYLVQRYETDNSAYSLNGMNIIFKKSQDDKKLENLDGKCEIKNRDRTSLSGYEVLSLAERYAKTMSNEDLVKLLGTLLPFYAVSSPGCNSAIFPDIEQFFCYGLIKTAISRHIKLDTKDLKLAAYNNKKVGNNEIFLKSKGYQFVPKEMTALGIKTVEQVCKEFLHVNSLEPTKIEEQKLKLLNKAFQLFVENDKSKIIPKLDLENLFIYNTDKLKKSKVYAEIENCKVKGLFIDRDFLEKTDFMKCFINLVSESLRASGSNASASYSYALTNLIKSEINILMHNPNFAPQLSLIQKEYNNL